jgi:hypothetical protein
MAANGVNVSRDLLWILTNNNNAHMMKQRGIRSRLSRDPLNPKGIQSFRNAGSLQDRAITVQPDPSGKGVVLVHKNRSNKRSPAKSLTRISLRRSAGKTIQTIKRFVNGKKYRKDQKTVLLRRASAILTSQKKQATKTPGKGKKD